MEKNNSYNIIFKFNKEEQFIDEIYRLTQYTSTLTFQFTREEIKDLVRIIRNNQLTEKSEEYKGYLKTNFSNWLSNKFNKALFFHLLLNSRLKPFNYILKETHKQLKMSLAEKFPIDGMSATNIQNSVFITIHNPQGYQRFGKTSRYLELRDEYSANSEFLKASSKNQNSITQNLFDDFKDIHKYLIIR